MTAEHLKQAAHGNLPPRRRRRSLPPSTLLVRCGDQHHRVSLPTSGPIVLLDHPSDAYRSATLPDHQDAVGCLRVMRHVRGRASYNACGWYMWAVKIAPQFGPAGSTIRDRLQEFQRRGSLIPIPPVHAVFTSGAPFWWSVPNTASL